MCFSALLVDDVRAPAPLPLYSWPRRRIFPADPEHHVGGIGDDGEGTAGRAHFLMEAAGGGLGGATVWRVWLWLPPMEAGERAVRVMPDPKGHLRSALIPAPLLSHDSSSCACGACPACACARRGGALLWQRDSDALPIHTFAPSLTSTSPHVLLQHTHTAALAELRTKFRRLPFIHRRPGSSSGRSPRRSWLASIR